MVTVSEARVESEIEVLAPKKIWYKVLGDLARKQPVGVAGAIIVLAMIFAALFADFITAYNPVAKGCPYCREPVVQVIRVLRP